MSIDSLINSVKANNIIGQTFIELATVKSTNSYAIDQIQANLAAHGTTYFAWEQTAGRGQRGKEWNSVAGENITVSIVIDPKICCVNQHFALSEAIALACCQFFNTYTNGDCTIKWPNDIYWNDRKAGGILIENIYRGQQWQWAIVGIGLNVNQTSFPDFGNKKGVSLKQITGNNYPIISLTKELCKYINFYINILFSGNHEIHREYNNKLYKKNEVATLAINDQILDYTIVGVSENGELLIENQGESKAVTWGNITWV